MIRKTISGESWRSDTPTYTSDDDLEIADVKTFSSAEGITITLDSMLKEARDVAINNYSSLYLTGKKALSSVATLKTNFKQYPIKFTSFLVRVNGYQLGIDPNSYVLGVAETPYTAEQVRALSSTNPEVIPSISFNTTHSDMTNGNYFEFELIDQFKIKISHFDSQKTTYLTLHNGSSKTTWESDLNGDGSETDPQIFLYQLDSTNGFIRLYKKTGISPRVFPLESFWNTSGSGLRVNTTPLTGHELPALFRVFPPDIDLTDIRLNNNWVSYTQTIEQNHTNINDAKSYKDVENNYLINSQYVTNISSFGVDITPLKNQLTVTAEQSRNNPFPQDADTDFRDYTQIFAGTNQIYGNTDLFLGYNDYTSEQILKSDEVTYFHMPQDIYPYEQLNVAESGLIEAGALGGDAPVKADKIFKKLANYKNSSNFGAASDQHSGSWLCSWLYWDGLSSTQPIWLDRYYNPLLYSEVQAMSASPADDLITTFQLITAGDPSVLNKPVFDKVSDLTLEPGVLYAYHHIGDTDFQHTINHLASDRLITGIQNYRTYESRRLTPVLQGDSLVYDFSNGNIGWTDSLSNLVDTNALNISVSLYNRDWSTPFGYEVIGNYTNEGIGIYNKQAVTPLLMFLGNASEKTVITNTDMISTYAFDLSGFSWVRREGVGNLVILQRDGTDYDPNCTMYEYNLRGTLIRKDTIIVPPGALTYSTHDEKKIYFHYSDQWVIEVDIDEAYQQLTTATVIESPNNLIEAVSSQPYVMFGNESDVDVYDKIWWRRNNTIYKYDPDTGVKTKAFDTNFTIRTFKTDIYGDIYMVLNDGDKFMLQKYDNNRTHLYTKSLTGINNALSGIASSDYVYFDIISEFALEGYREHLLFVTPDPLVANATVITKTDFDGNFVLSSTDTRDITFYENRTDVTNYKYLKRKYKHEAHRNYIYLKALFKNVFKIDDINVVELKYDVTDLSRGWYHLSIDINPITGKVIVLLDGDVIMRAQLKPGDYRFSDMSIHPLFVGTTPYFNAIHLYEYLKQPGYYTTSNLKVKDLNVYNKSLNYFDLRALMSKSKEIQDIKWALPSSKRNYLDHVDKFFKQQVPGRMSEDIKLSIITSTLTGAIRSDIEADIKKQIKDITPVNTGVGEIEWFTS